MKYISIVIFSISILCSTHLQGQVEIMLVTSERKTPVPEFFTMFNEIEGLNYTQIIQPKANEWIEQGKADHFDVWVFYDLNDSITESQKTAYWQALENGQNMLFLHHTLPSYQAWPEYINIIGGRYNRAHPQKEPSTYEHNIKIEVKVANSKHPITNNLNDFTILDETYSNCEILPSVIPLLTTNSNNNMPIAAWIHRVKNAEVVYIQFGHDQHAFSNPNYRKLLKQSLFYLAKPSN